MPDRRPRSPQAEPSADRASGVAELASESSLVVAVDLAVAELRPGGERDGLARLRTAVRAIPGLTVEREQELGLAVARWRQHRRPSAAGTAQSNSKEQVGSCGGCEIDADGRRARDRLVLAHLSYAMAYAARAHRAAMTSDRYSGEGKAELDDVTGMAMLELLHAARAWDHTSGARFVTYLDYRLRSVRAHLHTWQLSQGPSALETIIEVRRALLDLAQQYPEFTAADDLAGSQDLIFKRAVQAIGVDGFAALSGLSAAQVEAVLSRRNRTFRSLDDPLPVRTDVPEMDVPVDDDRPGTVAEQLQHPEQDAATPWMQSAEGSALQQVSAEDLHHALEAVMEELPAREVWLVVRYWGLDGAPRQTVDQLAEELGTNRTTVAGIVTGLGRFRHPRVLYALRRATDRL